MSDTPETLAEGRFLRLQKHSSGWEWAERTNASAIVGLVALTDAGDDGRIVAHVALTTQGVVP